MENNYNALDLDTLALLYEREETQLKRILLEGASWEVIAELRKKVTDLAALLHQKLYAVQKNFHPAEHNRSRTENTTAPE